LASDEDREGEAISWHLCEVLGLDEDKTNRIVFHEITKPAILRAIEEPRRVDMNLVDAQQARRVLDRMVGFMLSPILWRKVKPSLSAGRVQSVAVRLVVDREREIRDFKPVEYHSIDAVFKKDLDAELVKFEAQKIEKLTITNGDRAKFIVENLKSDKFSVREIEAKERKVNHFIDYIANLSITPDEANPILEKYNSSAMKQGDKLQKVLSRPNLSLADFEPLEKLTTYLTEHQLTQEEKTRADYLSDHVRVGIKGEEALGNGLQAFFNIYMTHKEKKAAG